MCFIRPEDLGYYTGIGIHYFKLQGRHLVLKGDAVRTVKAYMDQHHDGDVMDLIYMFYWQNSFRIPFDNKKLDGFIKPFFTIDDFCKRDCEKCRYCEKFAQKIIDYEKAAEITRTAEDFYTEFDQFTGMIHSTVLQTEKNNSDMEVEVDFELN